MTIYNDALAYPRAAMKRDGFKAVARLANGEELDNLEQAALIANFLPRAPKKPRNAFAWVDSAKGKKDVRDFVNYVYRDDSQVVATNGHLAFKAPADPMDAAEAGALPMEGRPESFLRMFTGSQYDPVALDAVHRAPLDVWLQMNCKLVAYIDEGLQCAVDFNYLRLALSNPSELIGATVSASTLYLMFADGSEAVIVGVKKMDGTKWTV